MKYKLKVCKDQEAIYRPWAPPSFTHHEIPNANEAFHASEDYVTQLFQKIEGENFEAWCMDFAAKNCITLYSSAEKSVLAMHFAIKHDFNYSLNRIGDIILPQHHFNFIYTPYRQGNMKLESNLHYRYFEVHPALELLQGLVDCFPILDEFLNHVAKGRAAMLKQQHPATTPEMQAIIYSIQYNRFEGDLKKLYLETKVFELILLGLYQSSQPNTPPIPLKLTTYDIERIQQARDLLLTDMDRPCSITNLAQQLKIGESKLRRGFKQQYGATPFDFILEARMNKAKELLLTTGMLIREIAAMTGYGKLSNFISAFTKRHGQSPGAFRKGK